MILTKNRACSSALAPRRIFSLALLFGIYFFTPPLVHAEKSLELRLSLGNSFQIKNDVQIPNTEDGTRFSLSDTVGEGPVQATRLEVNWQVRNKHGVRLLLAPLSYTENAEFKIPVQFEGQSFSANEPLDASYKFNSWRVGYHYTLMQNSTSRFRLGGTLKIRDAEIRLQQGDTDAANDNIGLVPLLYLAAQRQLGNNWTVGADFDGLAGGPGRAFDAGVTLDYRLSPQWRVGADLRVLEGGADVDVYNFAQFNSVAIAVTGSF